MCRQHVLCGFDWLRELLHCRVELALLTEGFAKQTLIQLDANVKRSGLDYAVVRSFVRARYGVETGGTYAHC